MRAIIRAKVRARLEPGTPRCNLADRLSRESPNQALERLREGVAVLEHTGTTIELADYKRFTYALAGRVAHAHKEGGFLGIRGKDVSDDERDVLAEIASALKYEPPADRAV